MNVVLKRIPQSLNKVGVLLAALSTVSCALHDDKILLKENSYGTSGKYNGEEYSDDHDIQTCK